MVVQTLRVQVKKQINKYKSVAKYDKPDKIVLLTGCVVML